MQRTLNDNYREMARAGMVESVIKNHPDGLTLEEIRRACGERMLYINQNDILKYIHLINIKYANLHSTHAIVNNNGVWLWRFSE